MLTLSVPFIKFQVNWAFRILLASIYIQYLHSIAFYSDTSPGVSINTNLLSTMVLQIASLNRLQSL